MATLTTDEFEKDVIVRLVRIETILAPLVDKVRFHDKIIWLALGASGLGGWFLHSLLLH